MRPRPVLRPVLAAALAVALLPAAAPPVAAGGARASGPARDGVRECPTGRPEAWYAVPTRLPEPGDPRACHAGPGRAEPAGGGRLPIPRPGYHHLGATTLDGWSGILGRMEVRDPGVRRRSFDFVATRFLAKRTRGGGPGWLEVGWAETGWSGHGAQRIYTFDSAAMAWVFYDAYPVVDGDQIWVYLHSDPDGTWRAWLWWGQDWHLLTATERPLGERLVVEQYVEVHVDGWTGGGPVPVPPIGVDQVRVQDAPGGALTPWVAEAVATATLRTSSSYCLTWHRRYDTWSAGSC